MPVSVLVIGGGPGGYVAAIRAAQLGAEVVLAERTNLGGTCLNVGCIPTKVLVHTAEIVAALRDSSALGIRLPGSNGIAANGLSVDGSALVDWPALMKRKRAVVKKLTDGVAGLLVGNGVTVLRGEARFLAPGRVRVALGDGHEDLAPGRIIVATGSESARPPVPVGGEWTGVVLDSDAFLELPAQPESLVIIGGGVIGVEFAGLLAAMGTRVTVVEMMPALLPNLDAEIAGFVAGSLRKLGVQLHLGARVTAMNVDGGTGMARVAFVGADGKETSATAAKALVAIGRRPTVAGLDVEKGGNIAVTRRGITVDETLATGQPGVFAIGDVIGGTLLAHAASHQGLVATENALSAWTGSRPKAAPDDALVPKCIYALPEVATVGLSEQEAARRGFNVAVARFPLAANGKSLIEGGSEGQVKIVSDAKYHAILGLSIMGPRATDLIMEGVLAINLEATADELIEAIHPHPTVAEAIGEAALSLLGRPVHVLTRRPRASQGGAR